MAVKRFLAFAGSNYYPDGGWNDFKGSFETLEEAIKELDPDIRTRWPSEAPLYDWTHIVDTEDGRRCVWLSQRDQWDWE